MGVKFNPFTSKLDIVDSPSGEFSDIELALGTQTAPSLSFTGDPNTGIYSPGADQLAISTGGTGRLFVDASGYVGVGQASPSTYFHINGGTVNNVAIFESTDAGAGIILKDSTGSSTLQTNGAVLQFGVDEDNAVANSAITFRTDNGERLRLTSDGKLGLGTGSPGSFGFFAVRGSAALGGSYGNVSAHFSDGATTSLFIKHAAGELGYFTDGAVAQTFYTSSTERARIDSSGRLLVGTASSASQGCNLQIRSDIGVNAEFIRSADNSGGAYVALTKTRGTAASPTEVSNGDDLGTIDFIGYDGATYRSAASIAAQADGTWTDGGDTTDNPGRLVFSTTADSASSPTERMRITNDGDVFIGATSAGYADTVLTLSSNNSTKWIVGPYTGQPGQFYVSAGSGTGVLLNGTAATSWSSNSDERLKTDLLPINNAIQKVSSLRAVTGRYKTDPEEVSRAFLIAQDVQQVLPEAVTESSLPGDDSNQTYLSLAYTEVIPLLVAALKEGKERIETLEQRLSDAGIA